MITHMIYFRKSSILKSDDSFMSFYLPEYSILNEFIYIFVVRASFIHKNAAYHIPNTECQIMLQIKYARITDFKLHINN